MDALGVGYVIFETISFEYCVITEMMYERMDRNDSAEKKKKERKEKKENEDSTWNIKELDEWRIVETYVFLDRWKMDYRLGNVKVNQDREIESIGCNSKT